MTGAKDRWQPSTIAGHGFISDGQTGALVYEDGTIDWLCMPRFDSEACFSALLGEGSNGGWWLAPVDAVIHRSRRYLGETLILETLFETAEGEVAVTDFMPIERGEAPDIVRIVEGRRGRVDMESHLALRFDYGCTHPLIETRSDNEVVAIAGPNAVVLRADSPIDHSDRAFKTRFTLGEGERYAMVLTWFASHGEVPDPVESANALTQTRDFWNRWAARSDYSGIAESAVRRSLLVLKGLVHTQTGGMLAALTSSLPEAPGGTRNWDYRYCWLRDSTFTLLALLGTGHDEEAADWIAWLCRAVAGEPIDVRPFYGIDGSRQWLEWEADWLTGFGGARPVRFGNAAASQLQLDVYGEVIEALSVARDHGIVPDGDALVALLAGKLETSWREPDAGIWESRGEPRHHVYSKAMCWVAFDRAARMLGASQPELARRWRDLADEVRTQVLEHGFNKDRGAFVRAYDDSALDAAVLRLPIVGFISADDDRMRSTVAAIERELCRDGLVLRYDGDCTDDGIGSDEGVFLAVTCWLAQVYAMQGRGDEAERMLDRVLAAGNDLGLLSEETARNGAAGGNFPQALSHVAVVNAALAIRNAGNPVAANESGSARPSYISHRETR